MPERPLGTVTISRCESFPARFESLGRVNAFLDAFCADAAIAREHCLRITLVLEELFTNTVKHGHRGESDAPVWIGLRHGPDALELSYEDTAPPFNPYARVHEAAVDTPLEDRRVGGLGVLMTRDLARACDYAYLYGRNRIQLTLDP